MSKSKRVVGLGVLGASLATLLTGCSDILPLPEEERYQYINAVKDDLDYASAGEVVSDGYDTGDGVSSISFFKAQLTGDNAYITLRDRLVDLDGVRCEVADEVQSHCYVDRIYVRIKHDQQGSVSLTISDSAGGRR